MKKYVLFGIFLTLGLQVTESVSMQTEVATQQKKAVGSPIILGKLRVHNETTIPFYGAIYSRQQFAGVGYRTSSVEKLDPGSSVDLDRRFLRRITHKLKYLPLTGQFFDLERLVVARKAEDLPEELPVDEFKRLIVAKIGLLPQLFIGLVDGGIRVFTQIEWQLTYPIASAFDKSSFWTFINKKKVEAQEQFSSKIYPYAAKVTEGTRLSVGEEDYLKARIPKVKRALETLLQMKLKDEELPRIAFCSSGGGYRAMLGALGWFKGSEEIGLLDAVTYGAALSGSSWFLAPWVSSGLTLNSFHQQLLPKLETNLLKTNFNLTELKKLLVTKFVFGEPLSLTDIYGAMLAKKLLGGFTKDPQGIVLSDQAERVADGSQIYPLYTAILSEGQQYEWFEFNPHVAGSDYLNAYVPSWAFGRKFNRGVSTSYAPPQSLGFLMGIWGWVIGFKAHDVLEHFKDSLRPEVLRKAVVSSSLARKAKTVPVFNYTYGMSGPYGLRETLFLADAGIHFNLPLPPVLKKERKVDIIIMLDTTAVPNLSFKRAVEHARNAGHKFPTVSYEEVDARNKSCLVFQDDDPSTPTLIYMPLVKNDGYSSTFDPDAIIKQGGYLGTGNLTYTNQQANSVIGLAEYSMKASRDLIVNAIKNEIQLKRNMPA